MVWNWQQPDWPHFRYKHARLEPQEAEFLLKSGHRHRDLQDLVEKAR